MDCKCNNICNKTFSSKYIEKLLETLGPIILGSKPSEIINISIRDCNKENKLFEINNFFSDCKKLSYEIITIKDGSYRIFFYNEESLRNVFNVKTRNFLKFLGYPQEFTFDKYLNILIDKLHSNEFPHEIGIFLGYPLKDVIGFMGYSNYKLTKTNGWRVYGDESISDEVLINFQNDRKSFKDILNTHTLSELKNII